MSLGALLAVMSLGLLLYLGGLSATLPLGDASKRGFLLIPALPMPLYVVMISIVLAGVGLTLLASFLQRRRRPAEPPKERVQDPVKTPWQLFVSMLATGTMLCLGVWWLIRYGAPLHQWLEHWRRELGAAPGLLAEGTQTILRQLDSPTAGYALFIVVLVVYGGLALLAIWVLCDGRLRFADGTPNEDARTRQVRRAFTAGLHELSQHTDPRQAIIACYARLEHLLEDHGIPAYRHLTPQEYMGAALQGIDLPMDAFAGLVDLFEQARYSLHPLDDVARQTAMTQLEMLKAHLEWGAALATRA
jgi:hypothetical protein